MRAVKVEPCHKAARRIRTDLVCHVQGVVVGGEPHVRLLLAVGADERVDLGARDVVHALHSLLDLLLARATGAEARDRRQRGSGSARREAQGSAPDVDDEDEGVVVLNLLHRGLGGQRELENLGTGGRSSAQQLREANPRARQPCMAFARPGGTASARGCGSGRLARRPAASGEDSALPASRVASAGDAGSEA